MAIQSWEDARALLPTFLVVCVVFAVSAAVESITEFNLFELPFGVRPMEGPPRDLSRWGIKRAYGPVMNPIYFGMLQMLLFPWTMYGAAAAMRKSGPRWWRVAPVVAGVGVCCTASRAPMLGLAVLLYASAVLLLPHWRRILLGVGFATLLALVINYQAVLDGLNLTEGGTKAGRRQKIAVGGESVEYSSTMHRVYVIEVYSKAMGHAGLLGFGTDRTSEFPPRVPFASEHIQALQRLRSVDNCYILVILRFGLLGLFFFVSVGVTSVVAYARHAWGEGLRRGALAAGMAGAMLATMAAFLTVWMPHDFGFWFLWCAGAAGGLHAHLGANRPKSQRHKSDNTRDLS